MSDTIISPNMSLPVPIVGTEAGPKYATDLNNCMSIIDAHTHIPGSGVPITPGGININSDLTFNNSYNAINLRSLRFHSNGSLLAGASDIGCLYESGVDLYYNDGSGNQIRITQSGSVSGSAGTITGLPSGTASASYQSGSGTFQFLAATSTAANIDAATLIVRYPGSYPTPSGNYIAIEAPSSLSSGYALTLPALPGANNNFLTIGTSGIISSSISVDNVTTEISASNIVVKNGGITGAKIASATITGSNIANGTIIANNIQAGAITDSQIALGTIQTNKLAPFSTTLSASCGTFSTSSATLVDVTNLSCTITTVGRPISIMLVPDQSGNDARLAGSPAQQLVVLLNGTAIYQATQGNSVDFSPSCVNFVYSAGAGTYTIKFQTAATSGGGVVVRYCKLQVYEV